MEDSPAIGLALDVMLLLDLRLRRQTPSAPCPSGLRLYVKRPSGEVPNGRLDHGTLSALS